MGRFAMYSFTVQNLSISRLIFTISSGLPGGNPPLQWNSLKFAEGNKKCILTSEKTLTDHRKYYLQVQLYESLTLLDTLTNMGLCC